MIWDMLWFGMLAFMLAACHHKGKLTGRDEMFHYLRKIGAVKVEVIRNLPT